VTNANKCVGRDTIVIAQGINPIVNLGRDTSVCSGLAITLDAGNPGSTYLYNTGANTRTLSVLPAGLYTVAVTNAQKCIGRDTIDISVIPTAAVNFITQSKTGTTVSFGSDAMSAASYAWSFGDGVTDNVQAPAHNYTNNGVYTVRLIVSNQCGSDTATTTVTISGLGTGTVSLSNDELSLYPNPATAIITLNNKSVLKMKSVTLLNSLGSVVMQKDGVSPNQETLDLGALPAGTYMVRIQTDGGTFLRRLQLVK
jgi:PKD repeat protein